ncbi:hypothetical protein BT63DRAFT_440720 [Microthyrium microscopicum]|uniref:Exocyst complex protein EXO70 n=1 Tax=Microthyrium microscopicum TaxID=703497 RepID=A0A6A6UAE9_9PEZI|nr:hypothetical protein BT63DRAFT_440720 [Microthyrium microscopicum]
MVARKSAYAEESAEVEVLFANLEKLNTLTKKIQGSTNRLDASGKNVQTALGPIHGSTRNLKMIQTNVDRTLAVISRLQAPMEQRDQEETIIRADPRRVGLKEYIASMQRADQALRGLRSTSLAANQAAMRETQALVKYGARQLEEIFKQTLLATGASDALEPLGYITKEKLFPIIPREEGPQLKMINNFIASSTTRGSQTNLSDMYSTAKLFSDIRGSYVARSVANMAAATLSTARRSKETPSVYKRGDCQISYYKVALHGMLAAEFDNIRMIFNPEEYGKILVSTARPALADFGKTLKDLNLIVQENLMTDSFLAFDVLDTSSKMGQQLGEMAGPEIQRMITELCQPIHATAKSAIPKIVEYTKTQVQRLATLPPEGAAIPVTVETLERLRSLTDFLTPVIGIMNAIGDGNWGNSPNSPTSSSAPSLRSFDSTLVGSIGPGSDGVQIFVHFCGDVIETLVSTLDSRARLLLKNQGVQAVFMLNNLAVIEGMTRGHEILGDMLLKSGTHSLQPRLDLWRSKHIKLYLNYWGSASMPLLDVQYTSRNRRSAAAVGKDSEAIVASMPSKEKEAIKEKFRAFNAAFDQLVANHKTYRMEPQVRVLLAKEVTQLIEPLYIRFWDRYHEVDRKGKYVKYSKEALSGQLASLG